MQNLLRRSLGKPAVTELETNVVSYGVHFYGHYTTAGSAEIQA